ncbi:hypothetical protein [Piscinibacter sp.]|uniref:hypothetical protein n=1 Tax=Piscinibacter sp. TaxID=1903157 RepID=UPI002C926DAD|nr:hypothetical protein [Albitalea sp.]HUG24188.1 hypothetical protein [Albitalea sp.]
MLHKHCISIQRRLLLSATVAIMAGWTASPILAAASTRADFGNQRPSPEVRQVANGVLASGDHGTHSFVLLDKRNARVYVFDPRGRLRGAAPALLGYARGDHTVPGIGDRPIDKVLPHERTTPAGRFVAEMGTSSTRNEDVVWVDYDSAVSMHRVITGTPKERRAQRLASPTAADNRISYGCVNLPAAFYENILRPAVKKGGAIIYVLPETKPAHAVFPFLDAQRRTAP